MPWKPLAWNPKESDIEEDALRRYLDEQVARYLERTITARCSLSC